jgi:hypothetical protein
MGSRSSEEPPSTALTAICSIPSVSSVGNKRGRNSAQITYCCQQLPKPADRVAVEKGFSAYAEGVSSGTHGPQIGQLGPVDSHVPSTNPRQASNIATIGCAYSVPKTSASCFIRYTNAGFTESGTSGPAANNVTFSEYWKLPNHDVRGDSRGATNDDGTNPLASQTTDVPRDPPPNGFSLSRKSEGCTGLGSGVRGPSRVLKS